MKRVVIISGLSGAGKSTSLGFFEDLGYFSMDNVPAIMLGNILSLLLNSNVEKAAMVVDVRSEAFGDPVKEVRKAKEMYPRYVIVIFIEASEGEIVRRYALTRRKHPLGMNIKDAVMKEREILIGIKEIADIVLDSTGLNPREFREKLASFIEEFTKEKMVFTFRLRSFGYKYGTPVDADFVFDTRFFPNPFYIPQLSNKTGLDEEVREFFKRYPEMREYAQDLAQILLMAKEGYMREGRMGISIGIGCSGGRHRSVYITEEVGRILRERGEEVVIEHRDISRE